LIVLGWILFRATSLGDAGDLLRQLGEPGAPTLWTTTAVLAIIVVIGLQLLPADRVEAAQMRLEKVRPAILATGLAATVMLAGATVSGEGVAPFIYFRF
jgi:alginate O-acetyltransferase complex protein AlgI